MDCATIRVSLMDTDIQQGLGRNANLFSPMIATFVLSLVEFFILTLTLGEKNSVGQCCLQSVLNFQLPPKIYKVAYLNPIASLRCIQKWLP